MTIIFRFKTQYKHQHILPHLSKQYHQQNKTIVSHLGCVSLAHHIENSHIKPPTNGHKHVTTSWITSFVSFLYLYMLFNAFFSKSFHKFFYRLSLYAYKERQNTFFSKSFHKFFYGLLSYAYQDQQNTL